MINDARPASTRIYKYLRPELIDSVFGRPKLVTLKCSLPKDFNDPFELFLTIDFNDKPDALAFYADVIGNLPQYPTTCFSKSAIVLPMWAHYAQNLEGFVLQFSEQVLEKAFPDAEFADVDYSDSPDEQLSQILYMARETKKFRHTYFLQRGVLSAAYFTKASCWNYEQERRMLVPETNIRRFRKLKLLDAPVESISSIICGPRASLATKRALIKKAKRIGCGYFELRIGRSSAVPYFVDANGQPYSFDGGQIVASEQYCASCNEPLSNAVEQCSWCQIDDELRQNAALSNPFRILDRLGLLESYVRGADAIGEQHRQARKRASSRKKKPGN